MQTNPINLLMKEPQMKNTTARFDMYAFIHKGLRSFMSETLMQVGRMDGGDDVDFDAAIAQTRALLRMCAAHIAHEEQFVHAALAQRAPGANEKLAAEHDEHRVQIAALGELVDRAARALPAQRADAAQTLYRALAHFVGENFLHMQVEESKHNAALWQAYSDAELVAIHDRLVDSLTPEELAESMRWMLPSLNPFERTVLMADAQRKAPAEAFHQLIELVRPLLSPRDWNKLMYGIAAAPLARA
jgi:hemerythrin-like domain-containing protein